MFCHALMKYTYFDVLTNILKHMQGTWVLLMWVLFEYLSN